MLVLDSTIGCIEATESEVVDLYRSVPVMMTVGAKPSSVEAYVCTIKKKAQVKAYLAFVADDRRIYVYTEPRKAEDGETVQEALAVARSMGFSPQPVDLNYSPAMREVVVRNTKILRPPGSKIGAFLKHGATGAPPLPIAKTPKPAQETRETQPIAAPSAVIPSIPVTAPIPVAIPVAAAIASPGPGPEAAGKEQEMDGRSAASELKKELRAILAERDAQSVQLRQLSAQRQIATAELAGAREECVRVTVERDGLAQSKCEWEGVAAEKDALAEKLRELGARQQAAAAELAGAREECARLTVERDALSQAAQDAEKASADLIMLQNEIGAISRQGDETGRRNLELVAESAALAETLARANQEVEKITAERDAALKQAELLAAASHETDAQSEAVRGELASLCAEKEKALVRVEVLEQQKASAEGKLVALRGEIASLGAEKEKALARVEVLEQQNVSAEGEFVLLRGELASLGAEKEKALASIEVLEQQKKAAEGELVFALRGEIASLSAEKEKALVRVEELEQQQAAAERELLAQRKELALLVDVREMRREKNTKPAGSALSTMNDTRPGTTLLENAEHPLTCELPPAPEASLATEPVAERAELPGFPDLDPEPESVAGLGATAGPAPQSAELTPFGDLQDDFFSASDDDPAPGRFLLHAGLAAIEYRSPDEVVELHQSINNAYLSPDGKGQESCQGYICCLKKEGSLQVFAAIYGTKSGRTSVYLPEMPPEDEHAYARTVRGALSFAEEVGLMMEPVKLGSTPLQRHECLKRCPVLRNPDQK